MSKKKKKSAIKHPFLIVDHKVQKINHKKNISEKLQTILYIPAILSRHHLYPKRRTGGIGHCSGILLNIWCFKHFYGWNPLFQFFYKEKGRTIHEELTIDEIITLMIMHHPFIMNKVGTKPWRLLFKNKGVEGAIDLLSRMLSIKFNRSHMHIVHEKISVAIYKKIAA